jgi:hypothetical protein
MYHNIQTINSHYQDLLNEKSFMIRINNHRFKHFTFLNFLKLWTLDFELFRDGRTDIFDELSTSPLRLGKSDY